MSSIFFYFLTTFHHQLKTKHILQPTVHVLQESAYPQFALGSAVPVTTRRLVYKCKLVHIWGAGVAVMLLQPRSVESSLSDCSGCLTSHGPSELVRCHLPDTPQVETIYQASDCVLSWRPHFAVLRERKCLTRGGIRAQNNFSLIDFEVVNIAMHRLSVILT